MKSISLNNFSAQSKYLVPATWAILLLLCLVYLGHALFYWDWIEDDAYITLRYSANVVDGQGFVFNVGEKVEGYSNFAWVLLGAVALKAGIDPSVAVRWIGIISGLLCLPLVWDLSRRFLGGRSWAALFAPAILAFIPPMARHATNGLETLFFAFQFLLALWLLKIQSGHRRNAALILVLLGLALTRPEGFIFVALLLIPLLPGKPSHWFGNSNGDSFKSNGLVVIVGFLLTWGSYFLWRWTYFGAVFPNTYYAKMTGDTGGLIDGIQYAADFFRDSFALPLLALALVPLVFWRHRPALWHLLLVFFAYTGFVVVSGGDWMILYRFFVPVLPLMAVAAAVGLGELSSRLSEISPQPNQLGLVLLVGFLAGLSVIGTANTELAVWRQIGPALDSGGYLVNSYRNLGLWLDENTPSDASVAVSDIGAIGYFSNRQIIDMFGLVDKHLARIPGKQHHKTDAKYVLSRSPDYVVLVRSEGQSNQYLRLPDTALWKQPEFQSSFNLVKEFPMPDSGEVIQVFESNN